MWELPKPTAQAHLTPLSYFSFPPLVFVIRRESFFFFLLSFMYSRTFVSGPRRLVFHSLLQALNFLYIFRQLLNAVPSFHRVYYYYYYAFFLSKMKNQPTKKTQMKNINPLNRKLTNQKRLTVATRPGDFLFFFYCLFFQAVGMSNFNHFDRSGC